MSFDVASGILDEFKTIGFYAIDTDMKIVAWNTAMAELSGVPREKAIGQRYDIVRYFVSPSEDSEIDLAACMKESDSGTKSFYLSDSAGGLHPVVLHSDIMDNGSIRLISVIDIREVNVCTAVKTAMEDAPLSFAGMIGKDPAMRAVFRQISLAAESSVNVLITGESGTGKELAARAIHDRSGRANAPFVAVSSAALAESVLESELFGHVKGSFTGAFRDKPGKFELAAGGTIFLDEIGEITPAIQVKLLRVIQERVLERVGGNESIAVDMRIIAATNRDLADMVRRGSFREDLYYRLAVFPLHLPPLRERMNDIPLICEHFVRKHAVRTGKKITGIAPRAMRRILEHSWPGNVRELENAIEYAFVVASGTVIDVDDLPAVRNTRAMDAASIPPRQFKRFALSRTELSRILAKHDGNRSAAAREIGISRVALWQKMKKFELL